MPGAVPVVVCSSSHLTVKPEPAWARTQRGQEVPPSVTPPIPAPGGGPITL